MQHREEFAQRYGFSSFAQLLDRSYKLPHFDGEETETCIARRQDGIWFIWEYVASRQGCQFFTGNAEAIPSATGSSQRAAAAAPER